jgi:hypothetical protein
MQFAAALLASIAVFAGAGAVHAADCMQERATYTDSQGAYLLTFQPVDSQSSSSTHRFTLTAKGGPVMDGYVMASEPVDRNNGMLFFHCPEGDVTGDYLAACTVWQGVIYGHDGGRLDLLPAQGRAASAEILLSGLGPALQASTAWGKGGATIVPWDVLTLKGCS